MIEDRVALVTAAARGGIRGRTQHKRIGAIDLARVAIG